MSHDERQLCTGCSVPLRGASFDTEEGSFCCHSCASGNDCYCRRPEDVPPPRGPFVPFSGTGLQAPFQ